MFDTLSKIALKTRNTASLGGLYFKGGTVSVTNLMFSASFETTEFDQLNCYLPVGLFMDGYKSMTKDTVVIQEQKNDKQAVVSFKTGKATINVPLMNEKDFPQFTSGLDEENAIELSADGFLESLGKLTKAIGAADIFIIGNHAYKTDASVMVRAELNMTFPESVTLSSDFFSLFAGITSKPTKLLLGPKAFRVVFENGYVETGHVSKKLPMDFPKFFQKFSEYSFSKLDTEISEGLAKALSLSKVGDEIVFKKKNIVLTRNESEILQLDYTLSTPKRFDIKNMNVIIKNGKEFDFDLKDFIAFKGEFLEGVAGFKAVK